MPSPDTGRRGLLDELRRYEMFSSAAAFLVSFAICFVGLGLGAYTYAIWTLRLT